MDFTRTALGNSGFVGWIPFASLRASDCPKSGGIYVVTYSASHSFQFEQNSCGGWHKGRNPTVTEEVLLANWVEGADVVYIGKADQLKRRLTQFADFGLGKPVGHWGGRLIWQLPDVSALRVAWKETPDKVPAVAESELIAAFRKIYGKPPFANNPNRLGA